MPTNHSRAEPAVVGKKVRVGPLNFCTQPFRTAGRSVVSPLAGMRFAAAVIATAVARACRPSTWTPPVRDVLMRQIYFTGIGALPITCAAGLIVGVAVIAQMAMWLATIDQSALFGPLVTHIVVQILGPLLINFLIVGRSGTAIATELANMAVHHEIEVIDSQGVDPFTYLLVPRLVAIGVSALCLTTIFAAVALVGGYMVGVVLQVPSLAGSQFVAGVFSSLRPIDMLLFAGKTTIPGMMTGAICSIYGLKVEPVLTAVPQAATRAAVASTWALFLIVAVGSVLTMLL